MNLLCKALLPLAGAAVLVLVFSMGGPRAVHAIVATLVQVTNTPTNAVSTMAAPAASQLYSDVCEASYNGLDGGSCFFAPVPAGQTLFIETESISSASQRGVDPYNAGIDTSNTPAGTVFLPMVQQANNVGTDYFVAALAGRMSVKAGATPACFVNLNNPSTIGGVTCTVSGYLAPAQ